MHKHARLGGYGGMLPQKFLEIRCSGIVSEAILGLSTAVVATWLTESIFGFPCMHLLS